MAAPGIISAAGQLLSTGLNAFSVGTQNRKARKWSEKMYDREYRDSLAFWNMQNAYNTPEAQMNRFKDAGLNPNLIYGQGNAGNAAAPQVASTPRPEFKAPDFSGIGGVLPAFMQMELNAAQRDNLLADNTVKLEEAALKQAQRDNLEVGTARSRFDLDFERDMRSISADARRANLNKLRADTAMSISDNERRALSNVASLRESAFRILNMRLEGSRLKAATSSLMKDNQIKQLDIELRRNGIMPSDPIYSRILGRIVNSYSDKSGTFGNSWWSNMWEKAGSWFK